MKKTFLPFLFFIVTTLFTVLPVSALEKINNFRSTIHVNTDGTIDVAEKIIYDFGDERRHGIYRNIPYQVTNPDGKKLNMDIHSFAVDNGQGKKYAFEKSTSGGEVGLKIGDANRYVTGINTYVVKYKVSGALRYFSEHDELYWNVTGAGWGVPMSDVQSTILLPADVSGSQLKLACYTGPTGSTATNCSFTSDQRSMYFSAKQAFNPYEGLTIVVGFPRGIVKVLEPTPTFSQTPLGLVLIKVAWGLAGLAAFWWYIWYPVSVIIKWFRFGRDPRGTVGEVRAGFDPPAGPGGEPLTPPECGAILDEVVDQRDVAALMVELARRGHLRIEERKKKDFYLVKTISKEKKTLLNFEKDLLSGIFATGDEVRLKDMRYKLSTTVADVKKEIYNKLVKDKFFPKNPETTRNFYIGMSVFGLFTGNILLFLAGLFFGRHIPQKTTEGTNARNVAQSLKNFLTSQERQLEFQAKNQLMFEKLLPYAVAFGVEDIWAKRFEDLDMKQPTWYSSYNGSSAYRSTYLSQSLGNSFGSFSQATATVSSSGSGSGFSGGSSGGGGGGGGGGSW